MKILHLVRSLNVGGLEKVVVDLVNGLSARGVENYLGCLVEPGVWSERANVCDIWCGSLNTENPMRVFAGLCKYIKKNRIDVIHTHNSHPHKYGVPASIITGVPLVHTKHGRNWPDNPKWVWFSRQLSRFTKVIVPVSKEIEDIVVNIEKVPKKKVVTILNGVAVVGAVPCARPGRRGEGRHEEGRHGDLPVRGAGKEFVIGSIGRFSPEKQYPFLIRAFAKFAVGAVPCVRPGQARGGQAPVRAPKLILVGDGIERGNIEAEIKRCGVDDYVELPGMSNDVHSWLEKMDVFCLSSDQEGTSITLLEAGAAGLPAVVTDVGGNAEIVEDGVTGFVVPFGDEQAMCDAFMKFAGGNVGANSRSPVREKMGIAAQERIKKYYSLDVMIDKYMDVYSRVVL